MAPSPTFARITSAGAKSLAGLAWLGHSGHAPGAPGTIGIMTEMASLVLYAADPGSTAAFYRALGLALEDEDHGEGPVHFATELGGATLTAHEQMPWGCRIVAEDPDGRAVEVNQRGHCPG